jgi:hypothetical protein
MALVHKTAEVLSRKTIASLLARSGSGTVLQPISYTGEIGKGEAVPGRIARYRKKEGLC